MAGRVRGRVVHAARSSGSSTATAARSGAGAPARRCATPAGSRSASRSATPTSPARKRAELRLRASEERSRLIIDTTEDAFLALDAEALAMEWNRAAERDVRLRARRGDRPRHRHAGARRGEPRGDGRAARPGGRRRPRRRPSAGRAGRPPAKRRGVPDRGRPVAAADRGGADLQRLHPRHHRAQAARGAGHLPGLPRPADRPAQPDDVRAPPRPGARPGRATTARRRPCSTSTSTSSSTSTTRSATTPATSC